MEWKQTEQQDPMMPKLGSGRWMINSNVVKKCVGSIVERLYLNPRSYVKNGKIKENLEKTKNFSEK